MATCRIPPPLAGILLCAAMALAQAARAQEYQPYPSPKITVEQWQRYLATVHLAHERSMTVYDDEHVVVFSDADARTFYIFTSKEHPAHPAWITRQLVEEDGQVKVRQIGYFAGDEEPFAQFFRFYLERNEKLRQDVERRNR